MFQQQPMQVSVSDHSSKLTTLKNIIYSGCRYRTFYELFCSICLLTSNIQTVSSVQTFFLAMAMHPEVAKKAQAEIDAVVGKGRLPDFSDKPSLPYVNAVMKECLRWKLVTNLGQYASLLNS